MIKRLRASTTDVVSPPSRTVDAYGRDRVRSRRTESRVTGPRGLRESSVRET